MLFEVARSRSCQEHPQGVSHAVFVTAAVAALHVGIGGQD